MTLDPQIISTILALVSAICAGFWAVIIVPLKERQNKTEDHLDTLENRISKVEHSSAITNTRLEEFSKAIIDRLDKIERLLERQH